jgi:hypothetical protein
MLPARRFFDFPPRRSDATPLVEPDRAPKAWFKNGLFWLTQTIRILPPGKGGFDTAMKKPGSVSNPFRVQLKGAETA